MNMNPRLRTTVLVVSALAVSGAMAIAKIPRVVGIVGAMEVATFLAQGIQIYECKADGDGKLNWVFREPLATLIFDGKTAGRHYAGPTWESVDGSIVTGKVIASMPGATPDDIPWFTLEVIDHRASGALANVTTVLRLDTHGGVAQGFCETVGSFRSVPYSATYVFLRSDSPTHGSVYVR